jgi:hypothetical protein
MQRRYDLDWLRVIAFALLMLFHTGMMFSTWDWHIKNLQTSAALDAVMRFLHQTVIILIGYPLVSLNWGIPLKFLAVASGVSPCSIGCRISRPIYGATPVAHIRVSNSANSWTRSSNSTR